MQFTRGGSGAAAARRMTSRCASAGNIGRNCNIFTPLRKSLIQGKKEPSIGCVCSLPPHNKTARSCRGVPPAQNGGKRCVALRNVRQVAVRPVNRCPFDTAPSSTTEASKPFAGEAAGCLCQRSRLRKAQLMCRRRPVVLAASFNSGRPASQPAEVSCDRCGATTKRTSFAAQVPEDRTQQSDAERTRRNV